MGCAISTATVPRIHSNSVETIDSNNEQGSANKWKAKLTVAKAREVYETDGTVPLGCSSNILELRMHLAEPVLLKSFGKAVRDAHQLCVLMCWADILEFKNICEEQTDYQMSKAFHIYHKYIKENSVAALVNIGKDEGQMLRNDIRDEVEAALANNTGLSSHIFDKFQQAALDLLYKAVFHKYRNSAQCAESLAQLQQTYNQVSVDDFEYMEELGRGGFGCVVHCRKKSTGIHYAMKIQTKNGLLQTFRDDLSRVAYEKEALALCHHPFIVSMDYAFQTSNLVLMVMDLGTAGTLLDSLSACDNHRMPEDRVRFYAAEIVLALNHIHRMGMIYRDLKPANVLLCADGHIKLVDLGGVVDVGGKALGYQSYAGGEGEDPHVFQILTPKDDDISRALKSTSNANGRPFKQTDSGSEQSRLAKDRASANEGSSDRSALTDRKLRDSPRHYKAAEPPTMKKAKSVMGTGGFMAPEMLAMVLGDAECALIGYTAMVDYWSLAVTMHKLLTGKMPFHNAHLSSFVEYVCKTPEQRQLTMEDYLLEFYSFIDTLLASANINSDTSNIIFKFLNIDYRSRLGYGSNGLRDIKNHEYFRSIEWNKLAQKHVAPPYIPDEMDQKVDDGDEQHDVVEMKETPLGTLGSGATSPRCESFYDMLTTVNNKRWNLTDPQPEMQIHFANWDFVSPTILKVELGIESEMRSLDHTFQVSSASGSMLGAKTQPLLETIMNYVSGNLLSRKSLIMKPGESSPCSSNSISPIASLNITANGNHYGEHDEELALAEIERQCTRGSATYDL